MAREVPSLDAPDALFVQTASSFTSGEGTMTLHGISRATVYVTDRPRREIGHLDVARFVSLWEDGDDGFADDPPHAVLSFVDAEAGVPPLDTVVVLRAPRLVGRSLTYEIEVVDGDLPMSDGPCSLFVDVLGQPLAPVAFARTSRRSARSTPPPG